jgi:hypothetical protein
MTSDHRQYAGRASGYQSSFCFHADKDDGGNSTKYQEQSVKK